MADRQATYGWERWPQRMSLDFKVWLCRWCAVPLDGRKTDYCSDACRREIEVRCRFAELRHVVFNRDGGCCVRCGLNLADLQQAIDWYAALKVRLTRCAGMPDVERNKVWALLNHWPDPVDVVKALGLGGGKNEHLWETNHKVGIAEGGDPIDPDNLETLCRACHKQHTAALMGRVAKAKRLKARYNA